MQKEELLNRRKLLNDRLKLIKAKLRNLPHGALKVNSNGKYSKWYAVDGKKYSYLKKSEYDLASKHALRGYYEAQVKEINAELACIDECFNRLAQNHPNSWDMLSADNVISRMIHSRLNPTSEFETEEYNHCLLHPQNLTIRTLKGEYVRSKSEAIIANTLYQNSIPYRYECELNLDDNIYYPDFTILRPKDGNIIYWEHFGLFSNQGYVDKAITKLLKYSANGLIPDHNLIITFESELFPLDTMYIEMLIKYHILG